MTPVRPPAEPADPAPAASSDLQLGEGRSERHLVASLGKGLDVLTCFDRANPKLTVTEVGRRCGMTPASARRALLTLHELGYLAHGGRRFWLQPKVLLLANAYLSSRPLPTLVQPLLDALAERTRESASVAQLMDEHVIIVARSTARRSLTVGLRIGSRLPAYCSATGRVLLAGLTVEEAQARVEAMTVVPLTPRTVTTASEVLERVQECRERGHAICDGELELEVRSLALPLIDRSGATVAALSIAVRADRMSMAEIERQFIPVLRQAQARLQPRLGEA